ncbi:14525_t:CDS:2 [Gigaspora margarita]|uniref:14525_t:CDS:1 n=1 Tax=Gigaspora margarita TaxID=4874 RepID=A0ABM8W692_GIGMA|nr:14525_t:CDS:2 [Gigaspora margarita]
MLNKQEVKKNKSSIEENSRKEFKEIGTARKKETSTLPARLQIASGYLKEAAADWYKEERSNISYWKTGSEDKFVPPEKQHRWQIELNSLTQQEHERVDMYVTKFKRLLNRVNNNNCLPDAYIVRMFLGGLKDMNTALVAVVAPKSLSEAVAAARRVEAGYYYGRHNAEVAKQARVRSKLSDLKKRIDEMALNYAALIGKIKDAPAIPKNKTKLDLGRINNSETNFEDFQKVLISQRSTNDKLDL